VDVSQDTAIPTRLDALLMRVLDEEASAEERGELTADPTTETHLAALRDLGALIRDAVLEEAAAGVSDVAEPVMAALGLTDELSDAFASLRERADAPIDVADSVMAALADLEAPVATVAAAPVEEAPSEAIYSALHDGELSAQERLRIAETLVNDRVALNALSAYAELGRLLRNTLKEATRSADLDGLWVGVARSIGLEDPERVPGWEPVSVALKAAVAERSQLTAGEQRELADAVMAALPAPVVEPVELDLAAVETAPRPSWFRSLAGPALAMAAALLVVVGLLVPDADEVPGTATGPDDAEVFELAQANDAEIEELVLGDGLMIHVLQGEEEGAPMILVIEEQPTEDVEDPWAQIEWEEL